MYADGLQRNCVWTNIKNVFAHVVVCGLPVEGLVIAPHQDLVALFESLYQYFVLKEVTRPRIEQNHVITNHDKL